jgi:hypothetical protein
METALASSRVMEFSFIAIFFPERNKPLHVFLNGANLGASCGALYFPCAGNPTGSD